MLIRLRFTLLVIILLFSQMTFATDIILKGRCFRPILSIAGGIDSLDTNYTQNLTIIPPFQNTYLSKNWDIEAMGSLFLGVETPWKYGLWQIGLDYSVSSPFFVDGTINQFADPTFNNLAYSFKIQSQRILLETKFLFPFDANNHPYILLAAGEAINRSYGYDESPMDPTAVPMALPFANRTVHSFTYAVGLGWDVDVCAHMRIGGGYRYLNLGRAALGTTPLQTGNDTIKYSNLHANEFLLQLSYLG